MSARFSSKMKVLAILTLTPCLAAGASFTTGQAARLVIGQRTFTQQEEGVSSTLLGAASGLAYANDMLVVVDSNRLGATPLNHRVLLFKNLSSKLPAPTDELFYTSPCPVCTGEATVVLGQSAFDKAELKPASDSSVRTPIGAATDGVYLAVADSDNNRVLLWNRIPQSNGVPADVVLGQKDFKTVLVNDGNGNTPNSKSMRGPQGVWIKNNRLFVADTGNNRVLIWNSIPRSNQQAADLVVGAPDFNTFVQPDLTKAKIEAKAENMLTPVAVTSDGVRLLVSDLGHNRVLIWNTIPTRNNQPADVVVGQPDMTQATANNSTETSTLCASNGKDADGKATYPALCEATLNYPRFALTDGKYLFIADGGNDRVLVYNQLPTQNGAKADAILGQIGERVNLISDNADPRGVASAQAVRTPLSLAWDGLNLYVSDPFNRRVMVFTLGERKIPNTGVRNSASREVFAVGAVTFSGEVKENQEVTLKILNHDENGNEISKEYKYKAKKDERFIHIVTNLVNAINAGAGDPRVFATPNPSRNLIVLTARLAGPPGNEIEFSTTVEGDAGLLATTSGAKLSGGQDAAQIAPGTIVSIFGEDLSEVTAGAPADAKTLPSDLGNVQVYFDGIRAPLYSVSPTEIRAQIPWEFIDRESANAYVRTKLQTGEVRVTAAVAVPIILQNPGIFGVEGVLDPRPGIVMHGSANATGTVSVDGSVKAGDVATVTIGDRPYTYTVVAEDTLATIRDHLIQLINQDPEVTASAAGAFTRVRLKARKAGFDGNGIVYSASSRDGDQVILTATTPNLCCANSGRVTEDNPAVPGETIIVMATGLGLVKPDEARQAQKTGEAYTGPALNDPVEFVSSLAGGKTANVLSAGLKPGTIGLYEVVLELNSDIPTDPATQVTIAQDIYVSNIATFPVVNPNDNQ